MSREVPTVHYYNISVFWWGCWESESSFILIRWLKITLRQIWERLSLVQKQSFLPHPCLHRTRAATACPNSHRILTNYWQCQPCGFSLCLWLGFVGWLLSSLLSFHCFCVSLFKSASDYLPCFSDGDIKMKISQHQLSSTRRPDRTVHISCKLSGVPWRMPLCTGIKRKKGSPWNESFMAQLTVISWTNLIPAWR